MMKRYILFLVAVLMSIVPITATASNLQRGDYGYLYCHMSDYGEWTAFAISRDGYHYKDLIGGQPVFKAEEHARIEGGTRDAYITRKHDGSGYIMVTTDMCVAKSHIWDNYGIDLLQSDDLIHWTSVTFDYRQGPAIFCDSEAGDVYKDWTTINRVWAPQIFWDPDYLWPDGKRGGYMIYYSMLNRPEEAYDRMYYSYADESFTHLTKPRLLFDWGYATIDADINYLESDGLYHMLIKKEGGKPGIYTATSEHLTKGWGEPVKDDYVSFEGDKKCEGSSAFQLIGEDTWCVAYIQYSDKPKHYRICKADKNLRHFHSPVDIEGVTGPQHGSFMRLTEEEYRRLEAWSESMMNSKETKEVIWTGDQVKDVIKRVNTYWQTNNPAEVRSFWDNAAYHTGNMEVYRLLEDQQMLDYSIRWAEHNDWKGATEPDPANWKYKTYGEGQDYVLFGDWQICFQTYIDLFTLGLPKAQDSSFKVQRAIEVMGYEADSKAHDYWWWADALYMVMPVMTKMYKLTGDAKYLRKLYENILYSDSIMLDAETGLYFRDGKYVYPKHKTDQGKKDFWARGDGWVLAGLAKVLQDMPETYIRQPFFVEKYTNLARAVAKIQQPEGYWTRSMMDPQQAPGPETSGTAFFCYGLLWGVNNGYLSKKEFAPVIEKAWKYLTETALQADGKIGYVQPIGERAVPGQKVDADSQANFGVGAFLLAACEYYRYIE